MSIPQKRNSKNKAIYDKLQVDAYERETRYIEAQRVAQMIKGQVEQIRRDYRLDVDEVDRTMTFTREGCHTDYAVVTGVYDRNTDRWNLTTELGAGCKMDVRAFEWVVYDRLATNRQIRIAKNDPRKKHIEARVQAELANPPRESQEVIDMINRIAGRTVL